MALVAVAGGLIIQGVLDVRLVRPAPLDDIAHAFAGAYALTAALASLAATGVATGSRRPAPS